MFFFFPFHFLPFFTLSISLSLYAIISLSFLAHSLILSLSLDPCSLFSHFNWFCFIVFLFPLSSFLFLFITLLSVYCHKAKNSSVAETAFLKDFFCIEMLNSEFFFDHSYRWIVNILTKWWIKLWFYCLWNVIMPTTQSSGRAYPESSSAHKLPLRRQ